MTRTRTMLFSLALTLAFPAMVLAQAPAKATTTAKPKPKVESQAALAKEAKVSLVDATATALKEIPGGKVAAHELEREDGKLIYSFDIKVAGKSGIDEVAVDAMTGAMITKTHETPEDEAKEKAADAKAKPKVESQAALAKEAKVTLAAATATALKAVPGSAVKAKELEREDGKLIYSFEMKTAGKAGIDEVNVDAMTGEIVGKIEHEDDRAPKKPATPPVKKPGGGF